MIALLAALPLPYPFDRGYLQLALAAGLVVGMSAPLIGAFLVPRRLSLLGDGLGHLAFAGVAAGLLLGVWPLWTALIAAVAGALAVERLRMRAQASADLALALIFYSGIAAGVVLAGRSGNLGAGVLTYLFGSLLTVTAADTALVVGLGLVVLLTLAVTGRALFSVVVDEESARVAGLPVDILNATLAVLAAVTVVAAMRVVGLLLVAALMVLPVASGQALGSSFRSTLAWSAAIGAGSVVVGLGLARVWALVPGATIVLVCSAVYLVVMVLPALVRGATRVVGR